MNIPAPAFHARDRAHASWTSLEAESGACEKRINQRLTGTYRLKIRMLILVIQARDAGSISRLLHMNLNYSGTGQRLAPAFLGSRDQISGLNRAISATGRRPEGPGGGPEVR